ncbi:MAG: hypothetical protein CMF80_05850 [Candidatus Marinimicrobia bacterium]|nr:hypothetical protein [Candidatus Neomarinimicrobiota bacterium]|tara:strand:- start:18 stop:320 length:303 start_codon:yes stop_codon:yes gene_type:complete
MAYTFYHNPDGYNVHKDSGSNELEVLDTRMQNWQNNATVDAKADYYEKYNELASKYATGEEISIQYKNLSERALMRPINISFGITLLLYYIYDLAFNKNS